MNRRTPAVLCAVLLAALPAKGDDARYRMDLQVQDNTYSQNHALTYNGVMFKRLTLSANDELVRKTVLTDYGSSSQQQGKVALSFGYDVSERLVLGGRMSEAVNADGSRTEGTNDYNLRGSYALGDSSSLSQSFGSVSEERFGLRDWGVKYTTNARYRVPNSSGADIVLDGSYAGDDLRWGSTRMAAGGTFFREYRPGSTVRIRYGWDRETKRDASGADADPYTVTLGGYDVDLDVGYRLGRSILDVGCDYSHRGVESENRTGYSYSVDEDERELAFTAGIRNVSFAALELNGDLAVNDRATTYPDASDNEEFNSVAFSGGAEVARGLFQGLRMNGNYKKGVFKDEEEEDDRDDITVVASVMQPVRARSAVACSLEADLIIKKTVYINTARSINSRWNRLYRMGPRLSYRLLPWLAVTQKYVLSARYIENLIKEYYSSDDIDALQDRVTREFVLENGLRADVAGDIRILAGYDLALEEKAQFEGGLFESVFRRMPTGYKGDHTYRVTLSWIPHRRLTVAPSYEFGHWHEDDLTYDDDKNEVTTDDSRMYDRHTARFMINYRIGAGSATLTSVYVFKDLDGEYDEKKQVRFVLQLPLL